MSKNELEINVSKNVQRNFKDYFFENDKGQIRLPEVMKIGKVYDLGVGGWSIKARIYGVQANYHIDFYAVHRMTNSDHKRLLSDGNFKNLENLWELGYRTYENDPERTERERQQRIKENEKVYEILKSKGLR